VLARPMHCSWTPARDRVRSRWRHPRPRGVMESPPSGGAHETDAVRTLLKACWIRCSPPLRPVGDAAGQAAAAGLEIRMPVLAR